MPRRGDHHDPRGAALAGKSERFCHHLAQDQLLQAHAQGMGEHPPAQAPDGAGRDLQQPDAVLLDPHFGVDRPSCEPGHAAGTCHLAMDAFLERPRQPGGRDVEGFLEIRPVQGIGLVEQGEGRELAPFQGAFQRVLPSGNEVLDDQASSWASRSARDWIARTRFTARTSSSESSARITPRLPDKRRAFTTTGNLKSGTSFRGSSPVGR